MNAEKHGLPEPGFRERVEIVRLARPKHGGNSPTGVIIIGYGMADLIAASRFAKHGWPALQVRFISNMSHHGISGIARCQEAMDYLAREQGVRRFILMGNCALANICLNTAISDSRVVGLVLTNLYVPESFLPWILLRMRRHLLRPKSWLDLLRGETHVQRLDPENVRLGRYSDDVVLPRDFARCVLRLATQRGMRILIAFSRLEAGPLHFRRHRKAMRELTSRGQLRFELLRTEPHIFSASEEAAGQLNDLISDWLKSSWTSDLGAACFSPQLSGAGPGALLAASENDG